MSAKKPRLLDLFCGAGGAAMGYCRIGFEIVGVDINEQPRYPFNFIQADAFDFAELFGDDFDIIHASPPCQAYSVTRFVHPHKKYPDLIADTRTLLKQCKKPYVIENVVGAPLVNPIMLCGTFFDLKVYRHRLFEVNFFVKQPIHFKHTQTVYPQNRGGATFNDYVTVTGHCNLTISSPAMDIYWMNSKELGQAVPPAYTEYIGMYAWEALDG